jgi:hypothetical protein
MRRSGNPQRRRAGSPQRRRKRTLRGIHPIWAVPVVIALLISWEVISHAWVVIAILGIPAAYLIGRYQAQGKIEKLKTGLTQSRESVRAAWLESASQPPVTETDAVSEYPPELTNKDYGKPGNPTRDKLLSDPRSGTRPLRGE